MSGFLHLVTESGEGDDQPIDPDLSLAVAYVAGELSVVEVEAVEARLDTEPAFRERVQFVLDSVALPASFALENGVAPARDRAAVTDASEIEAGWRRFVSESEGAIRTGERTPENRAHAPSARWLRRGSMARRAAMIAAIALPMIAIAQAVSYFRHRSTSHPEVVTTADARQSVSLPDSHLLRRSNLDTASGATDSLSETQQAIPAPRPLGPIAARTKQTFASVARLLTVRGAVFVQDGAARQLWMFDPELANGRPVLDSTTGLGKMAFYGSRPGFHIRLFRGDSILFFGQDATGTRSAEGLVLGASGRVARIVPAPPRIGHPDCPPIDVETSGWFTCLVLLAQTPQPTVDLGDVLMTKSHGDSAALLSVNFTTHEVDTLAVRIAVTRSTQVQLTPKKGGIPGRQLGEGPPFELSDAWAVFRDGTLAIARGVDYHVDIVDVRGQVTKGPRAPFPWQRISDADRDRLLDSLRMGGGAVTGAQVVNGVVAVTLGQREVPTYWPAINAWPFLLNSGPFRSSSINPQVGQGSATAPVVIVDEDERIWVNELQRFGGDTISVYGIFDKRGQFLERVKLPATQLLMGFGPGGAVYVSVMDGGRATVLKRTFK